MLKRNLCYYSPLRIAFFRKLSSLFSQKDAQSRVTRHRGERRGLRNNDPLGRFISNER